MLVIDDVWVSYGSHQVLRGVNATDFSPGAVTGLLGSNAAGKSTLVKAIAGLKKIARGSCHILVHGQPLEGKKRREAVGYVPQDLLTSASLTALESIMVSSTRNSRLRFREDSLHAAAKVMEYLGISSLAQRYVHELSGGQRQLVAVAQMLVRQPRVMLLDEPTSALDLRHQVELLQLIRRQVQQHSSVALIAIHDLNLAARYCDQLIVLHQGRVVASGAPADVLTPDLLGSVYGLRARVIDDAGTPVVCPVAQ